MQVHFQNTPALKQTTSRPNRAQRKKCDERKPTCIRCARSDKICERFADADNTTPPSPTEIQQLASPCRPLSNRIQIDPTQSRFTELGFEILTQQACQDAFGIGASVWTRLLPQLSSTNPTVNAAIASLGATYEAVVLRPAHSFRLGEYHASMQYHKALELLRLDVLLQNHGRIPSFLASLLLAAVEVLSRHFNNALMHLHGAFTIIRQCTNSSGHSSALSGRLALHDVEQSAAVDDSQNLYLMAQALDVQTASYAFSRPPQLPSSMSASDGSATITLSDLFTPNEAESQLIPLLHACYHYAVTAARHKYLPRIDIPSNIALDQSRYIALLSQWISKLDRRMSVSTKHDFLTCKPKPSIHPQLPLLVQRIQCVSAIIYLSNILNYKETSYDAFISYFEQIVTDATILLENQSAGSCLGNPENRFRLISPISQPVYLTALKCRQGVIRRRAIHLLGLTGREGPWHGIICQRVAQRAMEIEEDQVLRKESLLLLEENHDVTSVPEALRLHGSGMEFDEARLPGKGFIVAHFSRCVDTELMVRRTDVSWESKKNWDIWTERITI